METTLPALRNWRLMLMLLSLCCASAMASDELETKFDSQDALWLKQ